MARQAGVVYLLILLPGMIVHLCWCMRYVNYKEYGLENEKICNFMNTKGKHDIRNTTAVVVKQNHFFDHWSVIKDVRCRFIFKTSRGEGLFAVINKMFFRHNGTECLDYVRFKRSDGHQTSKFCGDVSHATLSYAFLNPIDSTQNSRYTEFDPLRHLSGAELETEIFISKEKIISGPSLRLSIVYTPFKDCEWTKSEQFTQVGYNNCIRKEYICDGIVNCPPVACRDEVDCTIPNIVSRDDNVPEVTVGAVTTVILCSIIFVLCLWICKRSQKLCWSSDCAGPNVCSRPNSPPPDADGSANRAVPTAPMLEVAVSPVADKDLPPSYDSLFPEQSNPARS